METYQKGKTLYEGKASRLCQAADLQGNVDPNFLIIDRKNDITKLDGQVRDSIEGKGAYTNRISNVIFRMLEEHGIPTHYVRELSSNETLVKQTTPLKLEVVVRNIATGSLCKALPIKPGTVLQYPIIELDYKDDELGDPLINHGRALALGVVGDEAELLQIEEMAGTINDVLQDFFEEMGITLVDFKLEFGRLPSGEIILIDEISPDTCRLWDAETGQSLDKDIFRNGKGNDATAAAYREVFERLVGE